MIAKALEIRDRATFVPALAVEMTPLNPYDYYEVIPNEEAAEAQRYLLRRCGYPLDPPSILLTRLDGSGRATADPYDWGDRTFQVAHDYITKHWASLSDGDVVDVEFILGESTTPKASERITDPFP